MREILEGVILASILAIVALVIQVLWGTWYTFAFGLLVVAVSLVLIVRDS